jgi:hypothetical protein
MISLETWIRRYFPEDQHAAVTKILASYGAETWHREETRVKRDALIISRGSLDKLRETIELAMRDYRDILIGEQIDKWLIGEIKRFET